MSNEQILDSIPTADLLRALVKREGICSLFQQNVHVIMVHENHLKAATSNG